MWREQPRPTTPTRQLLPVRLRWGPFWRAGRAWAAASVQTHFSMMPLVKVTVHPAEFARPEASSCTSWLTIDPRVATKLLSMKNRRISDVAASSRPCAAALALAELTDAGHDNHPSPLTPLHQLKRRVGDPRVEFKLHGFWGNSRRRLKLLNLALLVV